VRVELPEADLLKVYREMRRLALEEALGMAELDLAQIRRRLAEYRKRD